MHADASSDQSVAVHTETTDRVPENATVVDANDSSVAEKEVLQAILRDTIENGDGWRDVERSQYDRMSRELAQVEETFPGVLDEYDAFVFEVDGKYVVVSDTALI